MTDERKIGLSQHRLFCECGNVVTAPSASAYIEPGGIRHQWVCDSCRQTFETSIAPVNEAASREPHHSEKELTMPTEVKGGGRQVLRNIVCIMSMGFMFPHALMEEDDRKAAQKDFKDQTSVKRKLE